MISRRERSFFLFGLLMFTAVLVRIPSSRVWEFHAEQVGWLMGMLLMLYLAERPISQRYPGYLPVYLILQTTLVAVLLLIQPSLDFFAILFLPLTIQAMRVFKSTVGFVWSGLFVATAAACLIWDLGFSTAAIGLVFVYGAPILFTGVFVQAIRRSDEAKAESEALLAELREAHRRLQIYAAQAEELAAIRERNRLARDLHDSVTQTLFSLRLNLESARTRLQPDPAGLPQALQNAEALAQNALSEMRRLIFELRPEELEHGLQHALQQHISKLNDHYGLDVNLRWKGQNTLSAEQELLLFRIVQEALNNVVKHAGTDLASLALEFRESEACLEISDHGRGFVPADRLDGERHLGLESMRERAQALQGRLQVDSRPGSGTRLSVVIPLDPELAHES